MNEMLFKSLSFSITAVVFILTALFLLLYRLNKNKKNSMIYYYLIIITLIIALLEMISTFTIKNINNFELLNQIICRLSAFFSLVWTFIFTNYIFMHEKKYLTKLYYIFVIIGLIISLIVCITLPISFESERYFAPTGPLMIYTYLWCISMILIQGYMLLSKKIVIKNLAMFPLYIGAIVYIILYSYQIISGNYFNLQGFMFTTIIMVLLYSAESQDEKLIEEFEEQKDESERVNQEKEKFLYNMSKEVRTPMSNIIGLCNLIMLNKGKLILNEVKYDGKEIHSESKRLLLSINNILDLARYEAGKEELSEKEYSFEEFIYELNNDIINKYNIYPRYTFSDDIPSNLYGDTTKLKKIIDLIIEKEEKDVLIGRIDFDYICDNKENGIFNGLIYMSIIYDGIKEKNAENGLDLELSIIEKCSELLNCQIECNDLSKVKREYTIKFHQKINGIQLLENMDIKIEEKNKQIIESRKQNQTVDYSDKRILVVDDSQMNINILKRLFKNYNFILDSVLSGEECLKKCKLNKYDLIFLDDMMPGLSGVETLNELKLDHKDLPPIIVLTANAYDGLKEEYISKGFTDYLSKPIDTNKIYDMLNTYLNKGGDK